MPIYEYVCSNCQFKFDLLRPISQASEDASCLRCQQSAGRVPSLFVGHSTDESGKLASIAANACSSCSATDCGSCSQ